MEFEPMLTPRENPLYRKMSPEEDRTHDVVDSELKHYQQAIPAPEVVPFCLWCMLGVFVAGINPSRTWMSGSFESVRWNACVHRLDLSLCSLPKEFQGNGVRTHVNSKEKVPSTGKNSPERGSEPKMLHQTRQRAQHTTNKLFQTPLLWVEKGS